MMEHKSIHYEILRNLSHLPRKMVALHGQENMPEFVLHDLCQECCLKLKKAAYFVDNPDFDCCKGVSGITQEEFYKEDIWKHPEEFTTHMQTVPFNIQVRSMIHPSMKKNGNGEQLLKRIAQELELTNPEFYTWDMKHDNHGILIFERPEETEWLDEHLDCSVYLLSMCPIF